MSANALHFIKTPQITLEFYLRNTSLTSRVAIAVLGFVCLLNPVSIYGIEPKVSQLDRDLQDEFTTTVQPMLQRYCYECHEGDSAESSVDIANFRNLQNVRDKQSLWEQIRGIVRLGAMPPKDYSEQPSDIDRERTSNWIHQALTAVDCSAPPEIPSVTARRLNKFEYDNTIRDLFGLDLKPSREIGFVSDDVGNGFDNQGEVLTLSPLILEKYLQAAEWVSGRVISLDPNVMKTQLADLEPILLDESTTAKFLCSAGEYSINARMYLSNSFGADIPADGEVEVYLDGELIEVVTTKKGGKDFKWTRELEAGFHEVTIKLIAQPENIDEIARDNKGYRGLRIHTLSMVGPTKGLPPMPIAHQNVIVAKPSDSVSVKQAADAIVKNLLPKAFRRPCTQSELDKVSNVIVEATNAGWNFEESVQFGIQSILISPEFLFRFEEGLEQTQSKTVNVQTSGAQVITGKNVDMSAKASPEEPSQERLNDFAVASRVSYFLWSSMPDDVSIQLASDGLLSNDEAVCREVDRMLGNDKSNAMVTGFFEQWLGLRNLKLVDVDERAFPIWSDLLTEAMEKETFLFCKNLIQEGSISDVLTAKHTFVNPRLAEYYGVDFEGEDPEQLYPKAEGRGGQSSNDRRLGRYKDEDRWIRVELPKERRGLLTQASILTLTSNPTRTSPVKRGKWVLENIIGDPPPPAPPGVPPLEQTEKTHKDLTLRQQLELHRADPGCASCHNVLDPIGLGLENFNTIGQWRSEDEGVEIDARGKLQDGRTFNGPRELLEHLEADKEKVARHFVTQLLTYALGRGLVRQDQCTINQVLSETRPGGYRLTEVIRAIVRSKPFLYRTDERSALAE
jgi:hypothetical protein